MDYLGYNITPESPYNLPIDKINEIAGWVEGPKTLLEANAIEFLEGIDGHILNDAYSSLPLTKEAFFRTTLSEVEKGLPNGNYIIKIDSTDIPKLEKLSADRLLGCNLYLDITDFDFDKLENLPAEHGLVIQGGEEEKVGVKSFDDLDKLYDWLMD